MIEAFKKYVGNYDMEVRGIKLKYEHSFRVMELSKKYAEKREVTFFGIFFYSKYIF